MKTDVQTPMKIFLLPQHLVVPLFQRPYVWNEDDQWLPLWQDVRRIAELRIKDVGSSPTHFLGAVVLQANDAHHGNIPASNIIDGQQRLTTLQLMIDACAAVLDEGGQEVLASQLESLTHNQQNFVPGGGIRLKLRHSNRDQAAFDEVMNAEPPVVHDSLRHSGSLITRAHAFFARVASVWLGEPDEPAYADRADALVHVLTHGIQVVIIDLGANENSQEIFETLNARGTPLTAADLIKNYVFQRLAIEGADTAKVYSEIWPFETKFWEKEVSVGRYLVSRGSLFFNQWLVSRTGDEVGPQSTFTRFKSYAEHESQLTMSELVALIKTQADAYEGWTVASEDATRELDAVEMAVYRMQANGIELLKPALLWLHEPDRALSQTVIDGVIGVLESWVVRRQLLRLTGSDLSRVLEELLRTYRDTVETDLVQRITDHLTRLKVSSTYWPGDEEVRAGLVAEAIYRKFQRARLRMVLEALENQLRRMTRQPQVPRKGYPIEHILPQKWEDNWPVSGLEAEESRGAHVHRLGNLTLLTSTLNAKVSNGPWETKKSAFRDHDTMLLTSRVLAMADESGWDEQKIDARTEALIDLILSIWPVPEGHVGEITDPRAKGTEWVEVKHLVLAGLIAPGTRLIPRPGKYSTLNEVIVRADGLLEVDGRTFESPSGVGKYLRDRPTNGWSFWRLEDGRTLGEVRAEFRGEDPRKVAGLFDWATMHAILEALPEGTWTTYGALADAIGTAPQPVGTHITTCLECSNAHRVLNAGGTVNPQFKWTDPQRTDDPIDLLRLEGVAVLNGKAESDRELTSDDLIGLVTG